MNLYQKSLLAFAGIILIAILTVALLVGQQTESEFRQYIALYTNRAQNLAATLVEYYAARGNWDGVQAVVQQSGGARHGAGGGVGNGQWDFQVTDAQYNVVASSQGTNLGQVSAADAATALPLMHNGQTVGYLLPDRQAQRSVVLDAPAEQFLRRVQQALALGGMVAFLAAMVLAGLLARGIIKPVRDLTHAAQAVAQGDLEIQAPVRGRDEIAELAGAFNHMANSLQQAEQARQAQTADIAHELRNPLAVLQGTLEALADGIYDPTPKNIQPALDQVRTLNRLVDDLRTLALADAGRLNLDKQVVRLDELVQRVSVAYRETLADKGIIFHTQIASTIPPVLGDYERLTQLLNNILSNASRYVPSGSTVRLVIIPEAGGVKVLVADNGPGVSPAALPHLFDRFWRADPSRSRATGGTGLGLAIARHIIQAHNGRIWAEPTPAGGLTLGFWLPAA